MNRLKLKGEGGGESREFQIINQWSSPTQVSGLFFWTVHGADTCISAMNSIKITGFFPLLIYAKISNNNDKNRNKQK